MPCGRHALRIFGNIDFISRKTPKILILSAKLNILKKDVADDTGITRSVIVNALKKFDSAGVISTKSSGMKGTKIKVLNEVVYDELKKLED